MLRNLSCRALRSLAAKPATALTKYKYWIERFAQNNVSEPKSSAGIIVAHALNKQMFNDLTSVEKSLTLMPKQIDLIDNLALKRLKNIPVQYVIEEWDFCNLTLKMKPPVFIPRPETEDLVGFARDEILSDKEPQQNILEVGCGSGAISLALAHNSELKSRKCVQITAIDKNPDAVNLTKQNMELLKVHSRKMQVVEADITSFASEFQFDGIVSNPPYIPTHDMKELQPEIAGYESNLALHGGSDGLDVVRSILKAAKHLLKPEGWIWLEVDDSHPNMMQSIVTDQFVFVESREDFLRKPRFVKIIKR